jgi:hypothetical protein
MHSTPPDGEGHRPKLFERVTANAFEQLLSETWRTPPRALSLVVA